MNQQVTPFPWPLSSLMHVVSVNIGQAQPLAIGGRMTESAIFKHPVPGEVEVNELGARGDQQVDRRYHGGADKALNVYPSEHYPHWRTVLPGEFLPGSFGENLTTQGLLEEEVAIGDQFRIGSTLCEISQARQPCGTLAARHAEPRLVKWVEQSGKTGFYLRCLQPGTISAGAEIIRVARPAQLFTVREAYAILRDHADLSGAERLLSVPALSAAWREELLQRF